MDKHIWRTADGKLVEHGHPDAAFLQYPAGTDVPDADAKRLRLADIGKSEPDPEPEKEAEPEKSDAAADEQPDTQRAKTRAPANKAVPKPSDK
ncbi:hypothetical protein SD37_11735 [Amycolatopsis orientalis]|uniref:Uncharacterized protein n=1 Tax=Amycolatopsis orientalis TaxID=31958 RepID=A0A193BVQ1_AMYOR|nr:hypothetical protein SD37_11735 [Amycolatopsis orientalis]